jgi:hypothetical protein
MKVGKFVSQLTRKQEQREEFGNIIKMTEKIAITFNEKLSSTTHYL